LLTPFCKNQLTADASWGTLAPAVKGICPEAMDRVYEKNRSAKRMTREAFRLAWERVTPAHVEMENLIFLVSTHEICQHQQEALEVLLEPMTPSNKTAFFKWISAWLATEGYRYMRRAEGPRGRIMRTRWSSGKNMWICEVLVDDVVREFLWNTVIRIVQLSDNVHAPALSEIVRELVDSQRPSSTSKTGTGALSRPQTTSRKTRATARMTIRRKTANFPTAARNRGRCTKTSTTGTCRLFGKKLDPHRKLFGRV
jgi:hypothetical protein